MVAALVDTLAVEVPIDDQIRTWTVATLPGNWRSIQSRWELWHAIRTFLSIAAVAAVTISAVVVARPPHAPGKSTTPTASPAPLAPTALADSPATQPLQPPSYMTRLRGKVSAWRRTWLT